MLRILERALFCHCQVAVGQRSPIMCVPHHPTPGIMWKPDSEEHQHPFARWHVLNMGRGARFQRGLGFMLSFENLPSLSFGFKCRWIIIAYSRHITSSIIFNFRENECAILAQPSPPSYLFSAILAICQVAPLDLCASTCTPPPGTHKEQHCKKATKLIVNQWSAVCASTAVTTSCKPSLPAVPLQNPNPPSGKLFWLHSYWLLV